MHMSWTISNPTLHSQRYPLVKLEANTCAGVRSVQLFSQGLSAQPSMSIWQEIPVIVIITLQGNIQIFMMLWSSAKYIWSM